MKTLNLFITEQESNNDILDTISKCKFDFPTGSTSTKDEQCELAKVQESYLVDVLRTRITDYKILTCKEWCKKMNMNWSPKIDSYYGDIMILKDDKVIFNIDLKVGYTNENYGTPTALSLSNFGSSTAKPCGKFLYLCCKKNGSDNIFVDRDKLYNDYTSSKSLSPFMVSKNRNEVLKNNPFKFKIVKQRGVDGGIFDDVETLYNEDFIQSYIIQNYKY